jgi:hypothetical protein
MMIIGCDFHTRYQQIAMINASRLPATSITSWSDTQIVANVPTGAMSGQVNVTLAGNTVYGPAFTQTTSAIVTDSLGNSSTYTDQPEFLYQ